MRVHRLLAAKNGHSLYKRHGTPKKWAKCYAQGSVRSGGLSLQRCNPPSLARSLCALSPVDVGRSPRSEEMLDLIPPTLYIWPNGRKADYITRVRVWTLSDI